MELSALGYDAVMVVADAMKRSSSFSTSDIKNALSHTTHYPGVTRIIALDNNRYWVKTAVILKVDAGQVKFHTSINP